MISKYKFDVEKKRRELTLRAIPQHIKELITILFVKGKKVSFITNHISTEKGFLITESMTTAVIQNYKNQTTSKQVGQPAEQTKSIQVSKLPPKKSKAGKGSTKPGSINMRVAAYEAKSAAVAKTFREEQVSEVSVTNVKQVRSQAAETRGSTPQRGTVDAQAMLTELALGLKDRLGSIKEREEAEEYRDRDYLITAKLYAKTLKDLHQVQTEVNQQPEVNTAMVQHVRITLARENLGEKRVELLLPEVDEKNDIEDFIMNKPVYAMEPLKKKKRASKAINDIKPEEEKVEEFADYD
jgi:hypothetical protein